ncbi:MAG: mechanosensitive ion channel family protein [Bacteroidetes bacterium]|nr:mechanosensitive ion channel family protein [Bacteroidota bacterium]
MALLDNVCLLAFSLTDKRIQQIYDKGYGWILSIGPRIVFAFVALLLGIWIIRFIKNRVSKLIARKNVHSSIAPFIVGVVYTALYILLAFFIMQILGIRLTIFAALIAAFGAAAGLALSGTLQNFASGILILLLKPFKVGDNIIAQGLEGTVNSIQIFYTVIITFDNRTVIMPNSKLSNEVIINITHEGVRRLDISLKFTYDQDVNKVKNTLAKAFNDYTEVLNDPKARIGISDIGTENYTITCNVWINAHGFEDVRLLVNEKLIDTLQKAGIKLTK